MSSRTERFRLPKELQLAAAAAAALVLSFVLPGALAGYKPTSATLEEGSLTVGFEHG